MTAETSSLGHMPSGHWKFDDEVTAVFSDMLARSIPQYDVMRDSVFDVGIRFVQTNTAIVDLGCSRGDALAPFISALGNRNSYLGVEISRPMLAAARHRFHREIKDGLVTIADIDLRSDYPRAAASLTLSILALQFVPIEYRQRVLRDAFSHLIEGGAIILVEKILGMTSGLNGLMVDLYHARKIEAGYTKEEVQRKRLSLEGILVPVTARWNEELLREAGFREVDCFWRWMNFAAWVAVK